MQRNRIAFFIVGGISFVVLGWAMFREQLAEGIAEYRKAAASIGSGANAPRRSSNASGGAGGAGEAGGGASGDDSQGRGRNMLTVASMTMKMTPAAVNEGAIAERAVWFRDVAMSSGVDFKHFSGSQPDQPLPAFTGSGVAALDFDKDGRYDLYFGTGTTFPIDPLRPLPVNRLYRNSDRWQFIDVTRFLRIDQRGYTTGLAVGDFDNDGFPDLYIASLGADGLYRNQGDGTFLAERSEPGIRDDAWGTSAAFADIDGDGLLDIYVCNYARWNWDWHLTHRSALDVARMRNEPLAGDFDLEPETDRLYRNLGDGRFEDLSVVSGLAAHPGRSMSVVATDLDGDRRTDFIVAQDGGSLSIRRNRGDMTFDIQPWPPGSKDDSSASGAAGSSASGSASDAAGGAAGSSPASGSSISSSLPAGDGGNAHGIDACEFGIFSSPGWNSTAMLLRRTAEGGLERHPAARMIESNSADRIGWGCAAVDLDLDGRSDVVVTNGGNDFRRTAENGDMAAQVPLLFKNADGEFHSLGLRGGTFFNNARIGRGLAAVDLDNDGDMEIVMNHFDGLPAVLRNNAIGIKGDGAQSIRLQLVGSRSSRDAIGARFEARLPRRTVQFEVRGGGSYLSAHDRRIIIGVDVDESPLSGEIIWPDGNRSRLENLRAGESYKVIEPRDPQGPAIIQSRPKRS